MDRLNAEEYNDFSKEELINLLVLREETLISVNHTTEKLNDINQTLYNTLALTEGILERVRENEKMNAGTIKHLRTTLDIVLGRSFFDRLINVFFPIKKSDFSFTLGLK